MRMSSMGDAKCIQLYWRVSVPMDKMVLAEIGADYSECLPDGLVVLRQSRLTYGPALYCGRSRCRMKKSKSGTVQ